jgi:branched-chain amino acid transport system substrate-binding protein
MKVGKKVSVITCALLIFLLSPVGFTTYDPPLAAEKNVIVVGVVPLTGSNASWGIRNDRGMRYVFDMVNAQGGIKSMGGAKFEYASADTESKPDVAQSQAEKVLSGDVTAIFGCNQSPSTLTASQVGERKGIPLICVSDFDPLITGRGFKYIFRTTPIMRDISKTVLVFAQAMNKDLGTNHKKVGILCEDSIVGDSAAKDLEKYSKEIGYEVIDVVKYNAVTTKDFTGVLSKYKARGVELLVGHNRPQDSIQIVRNCKEVNFNPVMIGGISGGWITPEFLQNLGPLAEGIAISSIEDPDLKIGKFGDLKKEYEAKFKEEITATFIGGVSGAWLLYQAVEKAASKDPKKVAEALRKMDIKYGDGYYFQQFGVKFNEAGDNVKAAATIYQVQNGLREAVYPAEQAKKKPLWPKPKFK